MLLTSFFFLSSILNLPHQASPVSRTPSLPAVDTSYINTSLIQDYRHPFHMTPMPYDLQGEFCAPAQLPRPSFIYKIKIMRLISLLAKRIWSVISVWVVYFKISGDKMDRSCFEKLNFVFCLLTGLDFFPFLSGDNQVSQGEPNPVANTFPSRICCVGSSSSII